MAGSIGTRQRVLSPQELACLNHLLAGKSNKEIAKLLDLSPTTVASYLKNIYRKLGVQCRTHAVAVAIAEGLVMFEVGSKQQEAEFPSLLDGFFR